MEVSNTATCPLVVLASGSGSNLQAVLDATANGPLTGLAHVAAVVSDRSDAGALARADAAGVPAIHVGREPDEARGTYDTRLADAVGEFSPQFVVLAGWMRLLSMSFLARFPQQVINLHPARPGELPGTHAIERAWHEALAGERTSTGVMVHFVPDEGVDDGPVIATVDVAIGLDDTLDSLEARIHHAEHRLLVGSIRELCLPHLQSPTEIPA